MKIGLAGVCIAAGVVIGGCQSGKPATADADSPSAGVSPVAGVDESNALAGPSTAGARDGRLVVVNAICPVMLEQELGAKTLPRRLTRRWHGELIGFCCAECPEQWDAMSEEERKIAMGKAMKVK